MTSRTRAGVKTGLMWLAFAALGCGGTTVGALGGTGGSAGAPGKGPGGAAAIEDELAGGAVASGAAGRPATVDPRAPWSTSLPFAKSGQRLQALGYVAEGVEQFRTMHDSVLGIDCGFAFDAAPGSLRCVPSTETELIYLDAECTEPAEWDHSLSVGQWVSGKPALSESDCPAVGKPYRDMFQVAEHVYDEVYYPERQPVFERSGAQCVPAGPVGKSWPAVNRLIAAPEGTFVTAKSVTVDVGQGLRLSRIVAQDGAQLTVGVTNVQGTPCALQPDGECVPGVLAVRTSGPYFTALDAACKQPAFVAQTWDDCGVPELGIEGTTPETFHVRRLIQSTTLFWSEPVIDVNGPDSSLTTCVPDPAYTLPAFAPGQEVTGSFPRAQTVRHGTSALHQEWLVAKDPAHPGLVPLAGKGLLNGDDAGCAVTRAADGTLRCAPIDLQAGYSDHWRDALCSEHLYRVGSGDVDLKTVHVVEYSGAGLSGLWTVKPYAGTVFSAASGACLAAKRDGTELSLDRAIDVSALPQVFEQPL